MNNYSRIAGAVIRGLVLTAICSSAVAKDTSVSGHFRKDGTYVQPSHRSSPNSTRLDNYSTEGNINPYSGKQGTEPQLKPLPSYTPKMRY